MKVIVGIFIFITLTLMTQIGGVIYIVSSILGKYLDVKYRVQSFLLFLSLYLLFTIIVVPFIAPWFGREVVVHTDNIKPTNYLTVLLNRNYVKPELNNLLSNTAHNIKNKHIVINYLDASFPFINRFPLLPHLSHKDGKKIDISLIYATSNGIISNKQKSVGGYGVFVAPKRQEFDQIKFCKSKGYFQYDYPKYLSFGSINSDLVFSEKGTKILISELLKNKNLGKLFIEPHLKERLHLNSEKIKYHGCRAVRHDDHIHIQLK